MMKYFWHFTLSLFSVLMTACGDHPTISSEELDKWSYSKEPSLVPNRSYEGDDIDCRKYMIAHRGAWMSKKLPPNSLAALNEALENDYLGSECDVHQTKDNVLVICHDEKHGGKKISGTKYEDLAKITLDNGEPLPKLEDFLQAVKMSSSTTKLVIELKQCDIDKVLALVDQYGVNEKVVYVSFYASYCDRLVLKGLGGITYYVGGKMTPAAVRGAHYRGIDYSHAVFTEHPEWIEQAQSLGLQAMVWGVNNNNDILDYIEKGVLVTTDTPFTIAKGH